MSPATPPSAVPSPEHLLARYRGTGDPQALGALFDATAPTLFRIGLSLLPDASAAEDAVQETFLAALEGLDRYDESRPVMPWLVGILQVMAKRSRREGARRPDPVRLVAARGPSDEEDESVPDGEDAKRLREAIDALEEPYRSAALLRWRYGLTPAEIADVRGEHPGTTRSILSRGLSRIRELLRGAPAVFLLPAGPRGLDAVRRVVLERAASLPIGAAAAAGAASVPTGGLLATVSGKVAAAAAVLALVGGGAFWALRASGPDADRATPGPAAARPEARAPASPPPAPPEPAVVPAPRPPPDEGASSPPPAPPTPPAPVVPPPLSVPPEPGPDLAPSGTPEAPIPAPVLPPPPSLGVDPNEPKPGAPAADADEPGVEIPRALDERIKTAVDRGVLWLKAAQLPDGSWGIVQGNAAYDPSKGTDHAYTHPAGPTALALYALLKCGVPLDDPAVKKGFQLLRAKYAVPQGAYELSALLLAITATADPYKTTKESRDAGDKVKFPGGDWRGWAQKLHDALLAKRAAAKVLGTRYFNDAGVPLGGNEDLSSTQLTALALVSAERCGIKTDAKVWNELLTYALRQQEATGPEHPRAVDVAAKDGGPAKPGGAVTPSGPGPAPKPAARPMDRARGFAYILSDALDPDEGRATGGMTACGLATIQIARNALLERGDKAYLARDRAAIQQAIWDGLAWLDLHFSPYENPEKKRINVYHVYYLYCVERACDLLGNRKIGAHLWYREMAAQLLPRQSPKGFWESQTTHKPTAVLDTSFALLFLRRAAQGIFDGASVTEPDSAPAVEGRR